MSSTENQQAVSYTDAGLLIARVITGLVFFMHGYQKLIDNGLDATKTGFEAMDVPLPALTSVLVTFLELIGGAALIAGAFTRFVSILFVIDMLAAYVIVHAGNGFFASNGGVELVLLLGGSALAFAVAGPGRYSVDQAVGLPDIDSIVPEAGASRG